MLPHQRRPSYNGRASCSGTSISHTNCNAFCLAALFRERQAKRNDCELIPGFGSNMLMTILLMIVAGLIPCGIIIAVYERAAKRALRQ